MTIKPDVPLKIGDHKLMIDAALFAALSSLLTVGYLTLYNQGQSLGRVIHYDNRTRRTFEDRLLQVDD